MPRIKKVISKTKTSITEEFKDTYDYRVELSNNRVVYFDEAALNGSGLIRQENDNQGSYSCVTSPDFIDGLREAIDDKTYEKGEWEFTSEVESDPR